MARGSSSSASLPRPHRAKAFAPASIGNVAVGFDILGHVLPGIGDEVEARRRTDIPPGQVRIASIGFAPKLPAHPLPVEPQKNTASQAVLALLEAQKSPFSVELTISKGIPLSAGMGGSAASAVAAVLAVNELLDHPLPPQDLLAYAVAGESVASGAAHADNTAPCLLGGLQLIVGDQAYGVPVDSKILCVLVHPEIQVETKSARAVLKRELSLKQVTEQSGYLAGLIHACHVGDHQLLGKVLKDVCIEPQRAHLIPGFHQAQQAALKLGALGFSISGAGPSVFAWVTSVAEGEAVKDATQAVFSELGIDSQAWIAPVASPGARVIETV